MVCMPSALAMTNDHRCITVMKDKIGTKKKLEITSVVKSTEDYGFKFKISSHLSLSLFLSFFFSLRAQRNFEKAGNGKAGSIQRLCEAGVLSENFGGAMQCRMQMQRASEELASEHEFL